MRATFAPNPAAPAAVTRPAVPAPITTTRGRHGGMTLSRAPAEINLGEVARQTEPNFNIAECFDVEHNHCVITPNCALKGMLFQARKAFLRTEGRHT